MRAVTLVEDWLRPCFGREKPEKGDFSPMDPSHRFATNGDRKARCIWVAASVVALAVFGTLQVLRPQFGDDGRYYLLGSVSQVLAAVIALAASLPFVFAGLSDYLPSFPGRFTANWHFGAFVLMYVSSIVFALALLCFKCWPPLLSVVALAGAAGCLVSLLPYLVWIADRTNPNNHIDDLQSVADAVVRRHTGYTDQASLNLPAAAVRENLGQLCTIASVSAKKAAVHHLDHSLIAILLFWLKHDVRGPSWAADRGAEAWGNFMVTHADDFLAVGRAAECLSRALARECWSGKLSPSVGMYRAAAEALALAQGESVQLAAQRGLWRVGAVAQHAAPNGDAARAVAHQVAVACAEITGALLPRTFPMLENHVREWYRMLYPQIDPSQELAGFRALVVEEHTEFRRRLDEASR